MTAPIAATLTINPAGANNSLLYTAATKGIGGNNISVEYTVGGTAGSEVVTVTGAAISVQIEAGVSTATQFKTAWDAVAGAVALAAVANAGGDSGAGTLPGAVAATPLAGGLDGYADPSTTRVGLANRRYAAEAVLLGYDDTDLATVLATALAAGYRPNAAMSNAHVGGIIQGVNS